MAAQCPSPETLLAAAQSQPEDATAAAVRAHAAGCAACHTALAELETLHASLAALARADLASAPGVPWARLAERLEAPRLADRLPLGVVLAWRQAGALMRPAVAGTAVATLAGLALGTWLGVASQRGTSQAVASEPFTVSNLVDDGARGLAAAYFGDSESESEALDGAATTAPSGSSTSGTASQAGDSNHVLPTSPAAGDSQGARP
jgi:hypothetical protein